MVQAFDSARPLRVSSIVVVAIAFCFGILAGGFLQKGYESVNTNVGPKHGSIQHLEQTPFRKTSHIDENGKPIVKQQFIEPFVIPKFVGYSVATFKPGQTMMPPHEHKSLHEFFYVIEGTGIIQKDGIDNQVKPGTFLHMAPFEKHGIWVPKDASQDLKMVVCGVTVGEK
jgi:quercetin dioxygenase-like cupin family protein